MTIWKDTIMITDRPFDRAVEVTVITPDNMNVTNVQKLAEKAWRSVNKEITVGNVTVKVKAFSRYTYSSGFRRVFLLRVLLT